jgi:light-regulated signal transduction histidine kinase (bacteriophytochrome)
VRKDGSRFWANVVITALFDDDGTLVGFTKVTRDLTERRLHEKALEKSQKQLKVAYRELEQKNRALERANLDLAQRNAELQDFAYAASHDLQEPLRKISTFSELLEVECGGELGEEGRMFIDRIRQSVRRMSMLISGLLSYSHVATRTQPFQKVDLNQIIEGVLEDLQLLLEETGGRVEVESLPSIEADPIQMRRLFQNFIENALKFRRSGVPAVIRITPGEPAAIRDVGGRQMCTIDVIDNGIGFEEKYLDRIFVPFQRLHTLRVYEGAGLGLAICKRVVERHEGTITARSTPGRGTTFTISLPVNHVPELTAF